MKYKFPPLDITWAERYLSDRAKAGVLQFIKPWSEIEEEGQEDSRLITMGFKQFPPPALLDGALGTWLRSCPGPFDVNYVQGFFCLHSVMQYITRMIKDYESQIALMEQIEKQAGQKIWTPSVHQSEVGLAFTELYTAYSVRRWQHYGRRVFVIDPDTFFLLANTELPNMPLSEIRGPVPTFWLQFPKNTYYFESDLFTIKEAMEGIDNKANPNLQEVDGVMVSFSHTEPDHPHTRQLTMLVGGRSVRMPSDDNIVYFNEALDDRPVGSLWRDEDETGLLQGGHEIGVLTPRAVLNFCLYMMSDQPRLEPIPPLERRKFSEIRSEKQRAAALSNQEARLRNKSRLGYVYVGRLPQPLQVPREEGKGGWKLNRRVWVQGHWKFQPYGPKNSLRKLIHVPPYFKGKMFGEEVSASKLQPAREVE
jgi:hypothetical protein